MRGLEPSLSRESPAETENTDTFEQVLSKTYPQYLSDLIILWIMQTSVNPILRYPCRKLQEDVFPILHIAVSGAGLSFLSEAGNMDLNNAAHTVLTRCVSVA